MARRSVKDKVRDYANMGRRHFTYKHLMIDLGLPIRSATKAIAELRQAGEIVSIGTKREGIYKAATSEQKARVKAERLAAEAEDMRIHGDEYHQILSEVI